MKSLEQLRKKAATFFEEEKFKEVIDLLTDDLLEEYKDAELYAWRARAEFRTKSDADIFAYAKKSIDADPIYFMGYLARASAFYMYSEYDKAIEDYNKTIELRPDFATAYYNRGTTRQNIGENDAAIKDYDKAIELEPGYAAAYYNRGNAWGNKGEYDKASKDYNKAIELKPDSAAAYFNAGLIYNRLGDYKKAITNFEKAIELNHRVGDAQSMINSILEKQKAGLSVSTDQAIKKIKTILNTIRKICRSGDMVKQVVHYSKLSVADIIANDCHSCLHYSNAIYMNDPEEGITFLNHLKDEKIKEWYDTQSRKNESTIFLGSFLPLQGEDKSKNDALGSSEDQLLMWRTYGKDEAGMDAAGCNFVIDSSFFQTGELRAPAPLPKTFAGIKAAIENGTLPMDELEGINALLNVQYINKRGEILNDPENLLEQLIGYFKEEIKKLIGTTEELGAKNEKNIIFTDKSIYNAIQELSHLFKSSDYSFENEVRVIRSESRNSESIEYYKDTDRKEPKSPKHFYVKSASRILPYLDKIFLGPKVKNAHHWSLHFDYAFRKAAQKEAEEVNSIKSLESKDKKSDDEIKEFDNLKKAYNYSKDIPIKRIEPDRVEIIPSKCRFI